MNEQSGEPRKRRRSPGQQATLAVVLFFGILSGTLLVMLALVYIIGPAKDPNSSDSEIRPIEAKADQKSNFMASPARSTAVEEASVAGTPRFAKMWQAGTWFSTEDFSALADAVDRYQAELMSAGLVRNISTQAPMAMMDTAPQPASIDQRPDRVVFYFEGDMSRVRPDELWLSGIKKFSVAFRYDDSGKAWRPTRLEVQVPEGDRWLASNDGRHDVNFLVGEHPPEMSTLVAANDTRKLSKLREMLAAMDKRIRSRAERFQLNGIEHRLVEVYLSQCAEAQSPDDAIVSWEVVILRTSTSANIASTPRLMARLHWNGWNWSCQNVTVTDEYDWYGRMWGNQILKE